ncbi:MAG: DUF4412 domain-containing protein [Acidobacteriaceae bacterium]|nr:DUF4412 domain-containing protein [Acidobacteriaceae bacterium]
MKNALRLGLSLATLLVAVAAFAQEDFSGEIVDTSKGAAADRKTKIYATKDKIRFEPESASTRGTAVVINLTTHLSNLIMTERRMYMEFAQGQAPGMQQWNRALFRPSDANDACAEWLKLPQNHGGSCNNLGSETVNGRSTVKFQGTDANGNTGYAWMDKKIAFPIKWQDKDSSWELQNINEGSQPASLFEIPAGYQKFQMPAGMQNMQRPQ